MKKIVEFVFIIMLIAGIIVGAIEFGQIGNIKSLSNLSNVFSGLGWFLVAFIITTLFTAYLVVIAPTKVFLRFLAIPAWLIFSLSLIVTVDQFMGYSYPAIPPQAKVLSYYILKDDGNVKIIEAWMWLKDEGRARAYNFPWTLDREKALYEAQSAAQKGEPVEIDIAGKKSNKKSPQTPLVIYNWELNPDNPGKDTDNFRNEFDGEIEILDPETTPEDRTLFLQQRARDHDGEIEIIDPIPRSIPDMHR